MAAAPAGDEPDVYGESDGERYRCMTLKDFIRFRDFCLINEGWTEKHKSPKTQCYTRAPPTGGPGAAFNIIKVASTFSTLSPQTLYDCLHDADYRVTWDTNMIQGFNICRLDDRNDIGYYSCTFPSPLAKRDFVNQRYWCEFTNGDYVIANFSVPHSSQPVTKSFVRAKSLTSGYLLMPQIGGGTGTSLVYVTHSDVGGSIPGWILNMVLSKMAPSIMTKLETNGEKYVQWLDQNRPEGYVPPWRTAKWSWDPKEQHAAAAAAERKSTNPSLIRSAAADQGEADSSAAATGGAEGAPGGDGDAVVTKLKAEVEDLRRQLHQQGGGGSANDASATADDVMAPSLAPVGPRYADDSRAVQQYRAAVQEALNYIDRQYLQEGRIPSLSEYLTRVRLVLDGTRRTVA